MQHGSTVFSRKPFKVFVIRPLNGKKSSCEFIVDLMLINETHSSMWEESQADLLPLHAFPEINPNALFHFANQLRIGRAGLQERERYMFAVVITINHL